MIYDYEFFMSKLADKHKGVEESSLINIVKKGLTGINKIMGKNKELILRGNGGDWIKFYEYMTAEVQHIDANKKYIRKQNKQ